MLAEDEPAELYAMIETIQWGKFNFEIPVGCQDGKKAIDILKGGFVPDLIITDICMPIVDGLSIAKYVINQLPDTMVVVLSGYDEFKYAQEAIRLQVYDYILKPVTPSSMNKLLEKLKNELDSRNSTNGQNTYFLNRLLTWKLDAATIEKDCRKNKLSFKGKFHAVMILDLDYPNPCSVKESNDLELMRYGLYNISNELLLNQAGAVPFQGSNGVTNVIISDMNSRAVYEKAKQFAKLISQKIRQYLSISVSAGIGSPVSNLDRLYMSYNQAQTALSYRFFYGQSSIICAADIDIGKSKDINYENCEKYFIDAVKNMNLESAMDAVDNLIEPLKNNYVAIDKCIMYCQAIIIRVITFTNEFTGNFESNHLKKLYTKVDFHTVSNLNQLKLLLKDICTKTFSVFEVVQNSTEISVAVRAQDYIKDHYRDAELSLNTITKYLSVSTSYFSAIFKAHTGSTFVEYLTNVRMEKAKQLLAFTDYRTYEIAENVGFTDSHYFCVVFKRAIGMTPKQYRDQSKKAGREKQIEKN